MDILEHLSKHRSIRKFGSQPIEQDKMDRILQAAIRASSSGNMQVYSVIVTTDPSLKRELLEPHFDQEMVMEAPALLTFCADFHRMREWLKISDAPENFDNFMSFMIGAIDAILASQNAALAAEAEGLGICYLGSTLASCGHIGRILKCPDQVVPVVGFVMGYPGENPALRDRLPVQGMVHRQTYNDYDPKEIRETYSDRETKGWERYMTNPSLRARVESAGVANLAQIYTRLKYTKESHIEYSEHVLDSLKEKGFFNH
ncbi:MAG: nitroreductase family protein [Oligoflexales bacterium]